MNVVVSARVPAEIKHQADGRLNDMGLSTTELVNAAYCYFLETGQLPSTKQKAEPAQKGMKVLSPELAQEAQQQWARRAVLSADGYDGNNFKEILSRARDENFARFA